MFNVEHPRHHGHFEQIILCCPGRGQVRGRLCGASQAAQQHPWPPPMTGQQWPPSRCGIKTVAEHCQVPPRGKTTYLRTRDAKFLGNTETQMNQIILQQRTANRNRFFFTRVWLYWDNTVCSILYRDVLCITLLRAFYNCINMFCQNTECLTSVWIYQPLVISSYVCASMLLIIFYNKSRIHECLSTFLYIQNICFRIRTMPRIEKLVSLDNSWSESGFVQMK